MQYDNFTPEQLAAQTRKREGLDETACSLSSEIRRLRALFPEILKNLESGACFADCSLEFLEMIPNEVKLVMTRLKRERDEARAMLRRIARKGEFMDMEGQRLVVSDWLARRHISSENAKTEGPAA